MWGNSLFKSLGEERQQRGDQENVAIEVSREAREFEKIWMLR